MNIPIKNIAVTSVALLFVASLAAHAQDASAQYKSSRKANDIQTMLSASVRELRRATRKQNYMLASASTEFVDDADMNTEAAVERVNIQQKEAFALAVANLVLQETKIKVSDTFKSKTGSGLGNDPSNADQCAADYLKEQKKAEKKKREFDESFLGTMERIAGKFSDKEVEQELAKAEEIENEALNKMIVCTAKEKAKELSNTLKTAVKGGTAGVRIMDTLIGKDSTGQNRIGMVVGRSRETVADAGILAGAKKVLKPIPNVIEAAYDYSDALLKDYEEKNQEPPFGVFGVRGKRVTNPNDPTQSEMVYFGYGTAIQKESQDVFGNIDNSMSIAQADARAQAALQQFAYMSASREFSNEIDRVLEKVIDETLDMAKRGEKVDFQQKINDSFRSVISQDMTLKSEGFLSAPQQIDSAAYGGAGIYPDFYLSVWAWSPSMMTEAMNNHDSFEKAYRDAKAGVPAAGSGGSKLKQSDGVKSYRLNEDW